MTLGDLEAQKLLGSNAQKASGANYGDLYSAKRRCEI